VISFEELDLMARGGTVALLALWSWVLIRDFRATLAARLALVMNMAIVCHVVASRPGPFGPIGAIDVLMDAGSSAVFPAFWLFTKAWFEDRSHFRWYAWLAAAIPVIMVGLIDLFSLDELPEASPFWFPVLRGIWFALGISGLWIAWRGRADDLVEPRRVLRLQLVAAVGGLALAVNIVEIAVFLFGAPISWRSMTQFAILIATALLCTAMFKVRAEDMFAAKPQKQADTQSPIDDPLGARLIVHMQAELPHRDESMTIAKLAAQLGEQEYRLRRLINGQLGYRNFAQFLNGYRLAEVKAALADVTQKDVPILTIALDAGFGSLGPFNRAFREAEGMTPSQFRQAAN
jgi:AraC-like DNA-binding protein